MAKLVTLIGAVDRKPEELLRAAGMHVSSVAESTLGMLASPAAKQPDVLVVDLRQSPVVPPLVDCCGGIIRTPA